MNAMLSKIVSSDIIGGKQGALGLAVLAAVIFIVFPLTVDIFRLNLIGKYLTYAFCSSEFGVVVG